MRLVLLPLLASLAPTVFAIPQITVPAGGGSVPASAIQVKWTDDGTAPSIAQLKSYTLTLFVGGNEPGQNANSLGAIGPQGGAFPASGSVTGSVTTTAADTYTNGFYLQMVATAKEGGTMTIYSERFTVSGMTGAPNVALQKAITALAGSLAGPAGANDAVGAAPAAPAATPPAGANIYQIPYNEQTGLTRYAPMQGIPPTKITLKDFTPLFPTSAYTVATTWLPRASIVTTLTEQQTFSVASSVNSAQTQSLPTPNNDMQKFLARWKD